jgi:hypothetical protein
VSVLRPVAATSKCSIFVEFTELDGMFVGPAPTYNFSLTKTGQFNPPVRFWFGVNKGAQTMASSDARDHRQNLLSELKPHNLVRSSPLSALRDIKSPALRPISGCFGLFRDKKYFKNTANRKRKTSPAKSNGHVGESTAALEHTFEAHRSPCPIPCAATLSKTLNTTEHN